MAVPEEWWVINHQPWREAFSILLKKYVLFLCTSNLVGVKFIEFVDEEFEGIANKFMKDNKVQNFAVKLESQNTMR